MCYIFETGALRNSNLVCGWSTHHRRARWPQMSKIKVIRTSSVWRVFAHNSTKKSRRSTKIGRKVVRATGDIAHQCQGQKVKRQGHRTDKDGSPLHGWPWPNLEIERSKVRVTRPINAVTENQPCLRNGKADELQTWWTDKVGPTMTRITDMRSDLETEISAWLFYSPFAGGGAYYVVPATGRTACFIIVLVCVKVVCCRPSTNQSINRRLLAWLK